MRRQCSPYTITNIRAACVRIGGAEQSVCHGLKIRFSLGHSCFSSLCLSGYRDHFSCRAVCVCVCMLMRAALGLNSKTRGSEREKKITSVACSHELRIFSAYQNNKRGKKTKNSIAFSMFMRV